MKSGESVIDYFSRTMAIVNKMRIHSDKTDDVSIIEKILRSLTSKFNFVVCSIEESKNIYELSIDELRSSLLDVVETETEAEAEDIMTADSNKSLKIIRLMILKGEEEVEAITIPSVTDRKKNLMTREKNVFFLVLVISQKPTNCTILSPRIL
ncbi:hypothetical protein ACOSQ2_029481 [Xanthoceras sorbifolium]